MLKNQGKLVMILFYTWQRQLPKIDKGEQAHAFETVEQFYRQIFYETVDLILEVVNSQFDQDTLHLPKEIEPILLPAVCGNVSEIIEQVKSFYSEDVDCKRLEHQLSMVKTENKIQAVVQALSVEMKMLVLCVGSWVFLTNWSSFIRPFLFRYGNGKWLPGLTFCFIYRGCAKNNWMFYKVSCAGYLCVASPHWLTQRTSGSLLSVFDRKHTYID